MRILILAAGYGTRLYPLTLKVAKPLVVIKDKPIINFLIEKIRGLKKHFSIEEVRVVVNNKFYESFLKWKEQYKVEAEIINDGSKDNDDRLGAIKDIKFAIKDTKSDWLVLGGDNLFEDNLVEFTKFALEKKPYSSIGLYDVESKQEATRFGIVSLDSKGKIIQFEEKPEKPLSTLSASCVYFFPKESLGYLDRFISENGSIDAAGKYVGWLSEKDRVFGYKLNGKWIDIGHFDSLKEAKKLF